MAWRPYDGHTGTRHARNFKFPSVDRAALEGLSQRMHERRHAEFQRALKASAPRRNAGLGSRKESAVVRAPRMHAVHATHYTTLPCICQHSAAHPVLLCVVCTMGGLSAAMHWLPRHQPAYE